MICPMHRRGALFQSLGRDSVCSSTGAQRASFGRRRVSIPRSGFCLFKRSPQAARLVLECGFNPSVGILFVQAEAADWRCSQCGSFNPSVGILFVQACMLHCKRLSSSLFQSLGRDSVCSSCKKRPFDLVVRLVSIPRSGFCLFKLWLCQRFRRR